MEISKNLTLEDCTKSESAEQLGIKNDNPNLSIIENMKTLAKNVYEPLLDYFKEPIQINSIFRCLELNQALKGNYNSQHCSGQAIDLVGIGKVTNSDIFNYLLTTDYDLLIWQLGDDKQPEYIHISYVSKEQNRNQSLQSIDYYGKKIYQPFGIQTKKKK